MNVEQVQDEIIEEFSLFNDWMQRYEYMIELGKSLPLIEKKHKIPLEEKKFEKEKLLLLQL